MNKRKIIIIILILLAIGVGFALNKSQRSEIRLGNQNEEVEDSGICSMEEGICTEPVDIKDEVVEKEGDSEEESNEKNDIDETKKEEDKVELVEAEKKVESSKDEIEIQERLISWGFQKSSGRKIDTVILHSSYNVLGGNQYDVDKILEEYRAYGVSAHYIIDRNGKIIRLVRDKDIAYHAGVSAVPDGRTNVNTFSLGIEIVNSKTDEPTQQQYLAVESLLNFIKKQYTIKYVLGHSEIAPDRKSDPWNFDWKKIK